MRARRGVGIVDGVDVYTGETLEQIAARASEAARADAAAGLSPQGSALGAASLLTRLDNVAAPDGGGKCWSVDAERAELQTELGASK